MLNREAIRVLRLVRDQELVEEYEVGNLVTAGYVEDTGDYCDPYHLTEEGEKALASA